MKIWNERAEVLRRLAAGAMWGGIFYAILLNTAPEQIGASMSYVLILATAYSALDYLEALFNRYKPSEVEKAIKETGSAPVFITPKTPLDDSFMGLLGLMKLSDGRYAGMIDKEVYDKLKAQPLSIELGKIASIPERPQDIGVPQ